MTRTKKHLIGMLASASLLTGVAYSQAGRGTGGGTWSTARGDAQRTAWVRTDSVISVENLAQPGYFNLEWVSKIGHTPRESISEAASGNTTQLDPQPGDLAGSANNIYGYEVDTGAVTWTRHFSVPAGPAPTSACPGGMTAGVTRVTGLNSVLTGIGPGRGGGNGSPAYRTGVGGAGDGVPADLLVGRGGRGAPAASGPAAAGAGRGTVPAPAPVAVAAPVPAGAAGASGAAPRVGLRGMPERVYVVTSNGVLHTVSQAQGKEPARPVPFLPANANATGLILVGDTMYASTVNGCGGAANGVYSVNVNGGKVNQWKSGASPAGMIAFASSGNIFVAVGDGTAGPNSFANAIVALDPKTLAVKDWFSMPGASFSTTPIIFQAGGRELLAAATKDGRVFLLDTASPGGADHKTPLNVSAATNTSKTWSPSALTTWEDASQARWIALPAMGAKGGVTAFKVAGNSLQPGWTTSSDLASPSAPITVNGVVFAVNQGSATSNAVLYGFDASSGKEIWNSGASIKGYVKSAGLWSMNGQVHVATADATVYAFGAAQGRHL